jgi:uncharacterized protein YggU (UPF0235/DUF167 family)
MRIAVTAKTRASKEEVRQITVGTKTLFGALPSLPVYRVSVTEAPVDGRANEALVRVLAKHFDTSPSFIRLVSGHTGKKKVFEIS